MAGAIRSDALDMAYAKALKQVICNGIKDESERWRECPPGTEKKISLRQRAVDGLLLLTGSESLAVLIYSADRGGEIRIMYNEN